MRRFFGGFCVALTLLGCGAEGARYAARHGDLAGESASEASAGGAIGAEAAPAAKDASGAPAAKPRIIYSAEARVVVGDFAVAGDALRRLIAESGGYVATESEDRRSGASRSGRWVVRVPVAKFDAFLAALDSVGFVESRSLTSEDVTMEYVDVEARISNLKRLEGRFVKLLDERTGRLDDVLKVEQELARVRGEIEQAEGRLRYLTNKTDFGTVTVTVREEKDYVPPKAPTLGDRVGTTWSASLAALRRAGEFALLAAVALAPWALVAVPPVLAAAATVRLAMRRRARHARRH